MRRFLIPASLLGVVILGLVGTGYYPVALVEGKPIWRHQWEKAIHASLQLQDQQNRAQGISPPPPSSPAYRTVQEITRKESLGFLIEDSILQEKGLALIPDLERESQSRVLGALHDTAKLAKAAELLYGLGLEDFKILVLLPHARTELLREKLTAGSQPFEEWLPAVKRTARVRLLFTPYQWNGEEIQ